MKPQKPITDKMKERANAMYLLLKQGGFWTKEQLGERLGCAAAHGGQLHCRGRRRRDIRVFGALRFDVGRAEGKAYR